MLRYARNDGARNNILLKGLDVVRQYAALLERCVQRGTRARKALVVTRQANPLGRSMIEMLGVLAIIGVLSVGGIAGYSKAMQKWEDNKQIEQLGELFYNTINLKDTLFREYQKKGKAESPAAAILDTIDKIPSDMKVQNHVILDRYGNYFYLDYGVAQCLQPDGSYSKCTSYTFGMYFSIRLRQNGDKFNLVSERQCHNIIKAASAFNDEIAYISSRNKSDSAAGYETSNIIFGKTRCGKNNLCFSNLKPIDVTNFCKSCATEVCEFILSFVDVK